MGSDGDILMMWDPESVKMLVVNTDWHQDDHSDDGEKSHQYTGSRFQTMKQIFAGVRSWATIIIHDFTMHKY